MGVLITPKAKILQPLLGSVEFRYPRNSKSLVFSLEDLQRCVQGYVELVSIQETDHWAHKMGYLTMAVNEEGLRKQLPFNAVASQLHGSEVVGNALLLKESELD